MGLWIRHVLFYCTVFLFSLVLVPLFFICLPLPKKYSFAVSRWWTKVILLLCSFFLGITYRVQGKEFIPLDGSFILACKHQSTWETFIFNVLVDSPVFFLKKNLLAIPFLGWFLWKMGMIAISRSHSSKNKGAFIERTRKQAVENQRPIVIFPEGTRTPPGTTKRYHQGVYALYKNIDVPIIPVALNSGAFWPRRQFFKKPGVIDLVFMPPIEPLLNREEFMNQLFTTIEHTSQALLEKTDQSPPRLEVS